jgi:hypothetical protein
VSGGIQGSVSSIQWSVESGKWEAIEIKAAIAARHDQASEALSSKPLPLISFAYLMQQISLENGLLISLSDISPSPVEFVICSQI